VTEEHWIQSVHHDGSPRYVVASRLHLGETVTLRLRAGLEAPIERLFVRTNPDGEQAYTSMHPAGEDSACRWWEVTVPLTMLRTNYRFWLLTPEGGWWLNEAGMLRHTPTDANDFTLLANYHAPVWVRDAVFYEIFPDRFADGDPSNNVRTGEYTAYGRSTIARAWGERPRSHTDSGGIEFFGGDLQGIIQQLDYLQDLGISALYLTPIFTAPSNHKYDVADYLEVDPHFGGNEALVALRQALIKRNMWLMLDMVPNHCGATNRWFLTAQADPDSEEAEFFTFGRDRHHEYVSWLGVKSLPKLNYRSQKLRQRMYAGEHAVMRHWLRPPYSIDAWRMDVANMLGRQGESQLGHQVVRGMRRAMKAERHDAYLLGEHFFDGTPMLQGDALDATMNYRGFSLPLLHWLAGKDPATLYNRDWADQHPLPTEALAAQWTAFRAAIPWQIATQQFHLLGSHDTARALTVLGEDEARLRVAATLLFTYPGVPCIYYGDEIGLIGGGDPDNRRCMPWDQREWNLGLHAWYQQMIQLRRTSPALCWGGFQMLYAAGETLAFLREAPEERLIVVARRSRDGLKALPVRHAGLADGARLREAQSGAEAIVKDGRLPLAGLPAVGAQVWRVE
jgi:alpha-glucosidase